MTRLALDKDLSALKVDIETTDGRVAHGRFLFSGTVELFDSYDFDRVRQVGKHAWIVSRVVPAGARMTPGAPG